VRDRGDEDAGNELEPDVTRFISAAAPFTLFTSELAAMPSSEQLSTPSTKTQPSVSQSDGPVGSRRSNSRTATASISAASATLVTMTRTILPMK
jgi:hypothetical protein